jgi:hypothetical protein
METRGDVSGMEAVREDKNGIERATDAGLYRIGAPDYRFCDDRQRSTTRRDKEEEI